MSSARFVGHTDINRTEGVLFFYMTRNSDTLYRLLFQNTGFCGWEFEQATIIEAMVSQYQFWARSVSASDWTNKVDKKTKL